MFLFSNADWLSRQPWSNGRVGVFGKSWGGFNGLQLASMGPPALKAVVSLYSTDNRLEHLLSRQITYKKGQLQVHGRCSLPRRLRHRKPDAEMGISHAGAYF